MTTNHRVQNIVIFTLLAAILGLVGFQSYALQQQPAPSPAVVVTVDLEAVFDGLDERSALDERLTARARTLEEEGRKRREAIDLLITDRDLWPETSDEYRQLDAQIAQQSVDLQAYLEFAQWQLDQEKARSLRAIYRKIKDTIAVMSQENGYDLVIVDDSVVSLPEGPSEAETTRQISARRLLYSAPSIDATQAVAARMNADYAAGTTPPRSNG